MAELWRKSTNSSEPSGANTGSEARFIVVSLKKSLWLPCLTKHGELSTTRIHQSPITSSLPDEMVLLVAISGGGGDQDSRRRHHLWNPRTASQKKGTLLVLVKDEEFIFIGFLFVE